MFLPDPFHPRSPPLPLAPSPLLKELVSAVRPARAARALAAAAPSALIASSVYRRRGDVASCVLSGSPGAFCCMPFPRHHHHYAEEFPERASERAQVGTWTQQEGSRAAALALRAGLNFGFYAMLGVCLTREERGLWESLLTFWDLGFAHM